MAKGRCSPVLAGNPKKQPSKPVLLNPRKRVLGAWQHGSVRLVVGPAEREELCAHLSARTHFRSGQASAPLTRRRLILQGAKPTLRPAPPSSSPCSGRPSGCHPWDGDPRAWHTVRTHAPTAGPGGLALPNIRQPNWNEPQTHNRSCGRDGAFPRTVLSPRVCLSGTSAFGEGAPRGRERHTGHFPRRSYCGETLGVTQMSIRRATGKRRCPRATRGSWGRREEEPPPSRWPEGGLRRVFNGNKD